jgi:hypothetical protein
MEERRNTHIILFRRKSLWSSAHNRNVVKMDIKKRGQRYSDCTEIDQDGIEKQATVMILLHFLVL